MWVIFIFLSCDKVIYECLEELLVWKGLRSSARHVLFAFINIILKITNAENLGNGATAK